MKSLFLLISFSICLSMPVIGHEAEAVGWQRQNVCTKHQKETFDPARFQRELEQFIVGEACLSPQEASVFFSVYREWKTKERALWGQRRRYRHIDPSNDAEALEAIRQQDKLDIEIKKLQQQYHEKILKMLPAGKVLQIIIAEDKFHRKAFRRAFKVEGERKE